MKPFNHHFLKLSGIIAGIIILQSCGPHATGCWKNEQIPAGKRADFHQITDGLFKDLIANDPKHLESMMSKEMIDNHGNYRTVELLSNRLKSANYALYDEYYVVNKWKKLDTIKSSGHGINNYNLYYSGVAREMYFAFYLPKTGDEKYLISAVFGKYDYGWKLAKLELKQYSVNGKTAPELFEQAKKFIKDDYFADAATTMVLAHDCLYPAPNWQYANDTAITKFYYNALVEANAHYKFPLIVTQVPSHPQIFRIVNQSIDAGTYPMIYYLTTIKLTDTAAIKKENEGVKKAIGSILPGINKNKKYLLYAAFNKRPNSKETVDRYRVDDKLQ